MPPFFSCNDSWRWQTSPIKEKFWSLSSTYHPLRDPKSWATHANVAPFIYVMTANRPTYFRNAEQPGVFANLLLHTTTVQPWIDDRIVVCISQCHMSASIHTLKVHQLSCISISSPDLLIFLDTSGNLQSSNLQPSRLVSRLTAA
jgi:hypothetical protein